MERIPYDEFSMFHENAEEYGLPFDGPPVVKRVGVATNDGREMSALVWGDAPADLVLLHGGAQNAHTWDTVALALGRPLVAVDLPGHGHSGPPLDAAQPLHAGADDVATVIRQHGAGAKAIVGMSAGGLTTLALSARHPDLVRAIVLVDILPTIDPAMARLITDFVAGPTTFASFDEILARTIEHNPTRSESSLRRGILHNAEQLEDGTWQWRHQRHRRAAAPDAPPAERPPTASLWEAVEGAGVPIMLVRGMARGSVVTDDAEAELLRRVPSAIVKRVEGAGHSVQGDKPVELAGLIEEFLQAL